MMAVGWPTTKIIENLCVPSLKAYGIDGSTPAGASADVVVLKNPTGKEGIKYLFSEPAPWR